MNGPVRSRAEYEARLEAKRLKKLSQQRARRKQFRRIEYRPSVEAAQALARFDLPGISTSRVLDALILRGARTVREGEVIADGAYRWKEHPRDRAARERRAAR